MAETQNHWSGIREAGTVLGMKTLLIVHRILGERGFRFCLYPVMLYYYLIRKEARHASQDYLDKAKPYLSQQEAHTLSSFAHFMTFGEVLLDKVLAWMGHFGKEDVSFEAPDDFTQNRSGGIIIVSHLGNAEICGALTEHLPNIRLTALVHTGHADKFNSMIKKVNHRSQIELMQVTDITPATAMLLSERVERGEFVIIAGDRTPVTHQAKVSRVEFLGQQATMPQGAFILASLLKCPIYLMFCLKKQKRYQVYIELFTTQLKLPRRERQKGLDQIVQQYALRLQHYCLKAPLQWFNFYPFWATNCHESGETSVDSTSLSAHPISMKEQSNGKG